jgi:hypothetical protein
MRVAGRADAEAQVERIQFQAVDEGEHGGRTIADERVGINEQRENRQSQADRKRDAPVPPRPKPFARDTQGATRFINGGNP